VRDCFRFPPLCQLSVDHLPYQVPRAAPRMPVFLFTIPVLFHPRRSPDALPQPDTHFHTVLEKLDS
jgi:hypothetical protein